RSVRHYECRCLVERHVVRYGDTLRLLDNSLFGHTAPVEKANSAISRFEPRDSGADRHDGSGDLAAGRERPRGFELGTVFDDEAVGEIDAAGLDGEDELAWSRVRVRDLLDDQLGRATRTLAQNGSHRIPYRAGSANSPLREEVPPPDRASRDPPNSRRT